MKSKPKKTEAVPTEPTSVAPTEEGVKAAEAAATYFVVAWDPTGHLLTAHKYREHLSLAQAKKIQTEWATKGVDILIYKEST